ncbi:MAG: flagellar basal-body rod protein FlgF [Alphaproteobacteria bacterium]|nr:flagellar basal-body rod protein FlgF [Alphaproteobacteria bacterium]
MENSIYIGLSRQMALQTNMDIIANNVANANTTGFRAQNLLFEEYISDPRGADDELSFVIDRGQYQNTAPGSIKMTGNQLDVALEGPGFLGVQAPGGQIAYTRDGHFEMRADGTLVTAAGYPVASGGGGSITIPQGSTEINIDQRGFISNQDGIIGQLSVSEFPDLQQLKPLGNNLYQADAPAQAATNTNVYQGHLEGSNVQAVVEVTRMIDTLRAFQSTQQVLQSESERLNTMIERLTRTN